MAKQMCILVFVLSIIVVAFAQEVFQIRQQTQPQVVREINNNDGFGNYLFT